MRACLREMQTDSLDQKVLWCRESFGQGVDADGGGVLCNPVAFATKTVTEDRGDGLHGSSSLTSAGSELCLLVTLQDLCVE